MMRKTPVIKDKPMHIVSVYETGTGNDTKTDVENIKRHYAMMMQLNDQKIPFRELYGSYKGKPERSLAFTGDRYKPLVDKIASQYNQDSTISIHPNGEAHLHRGGEKQHIGKWQEVSHMDATSADGYSYDPKTKKYWIAK